MADTNSTTKFTADISQLRAEMQAASRLVRVANSEFKAATAGMDDWGASADGLEAKLKQLNTILNAQKKQLSLAEKELEQVSSEYGENSAEADRCRIKVNSYKAAVANTEKQLDKYENQLDEVTDELKEVDTATEKAGDGFTVMKGILADLASSAIKAGIEALKDFAKYTIKVGSEFEAAMDKVQAVSGASTTEMEALTAKAQEMGATTKFSATESAEAMNYMAMAGWKTNDMLNGIEGVMNLAAASGADLATTSDIVTDALTAMGYGAQDAGKFADVMAAASSNANTNVEMMGETFQYAAPIAGALGYSIEDTATAIGLMANAGIKGTKAGTALRSIMTRMSAPPKEAAEAMDSLGISITRTTEDGQEEMLPFSDVIAQLREKFAGLSEAEQTQAAKAIAGQNAMAGLLAIVNASDGDFEKLSSAIANSDGAAEDMANTMQDNLQGAITIAGSAAEGLGIALYDRVKGPLTDAVRLATELITGITDAITPQQTAMEKFLSETEQIGERAKQGVEASKSAIESGEAEVAKLDSLAQTILDANEQFEIFAQTDTSPAAANVNNTAEGMADPLASITEGSEEAKEAIDDIGNADPSGASLGDLAESVTADSDTIQTQSEDAKTKLEDIGKAELSGENLKTELQGIASATSDASREMDAFTKSQVNAAIQELAQDIPAIGKAWDEVSGTLKVTKAEFVALLDEQKRAVLSQAFVKAQQEAVDAWADSVVAVKRAESAVKNAQKAYDDYMESAEKDYDSRLAYDAQYANQLQGELERAQSDLTDYQQVNKDAANAMAEAEQAAKEAQREYGNVATSGKDAAQATSDLGDAAAEAGEDMATFVEQAQADYEMQGKLAEAHQEAAQQIRDAYDSAKEAAENAFSVNPFDAWEQDAENGVEKMKSAFDEQIEGMTNYADNLQIVSEHVGNEITPEFLSYLEGLGTDGAQAMQELAEALDPDNGNYDPSKVEALVQSYADAMDKQDEISAALAQDAVAFQLGLDEFSSAAEDWDGLDAAVDYIAQMGDGVSEEAINAFEAAAERAQEAGVKIPDGLKEGIESGTDDPQAAVETATDALNSAIEGHMEAVLDVAKQSGTDIPEGIAEGIETGGDTAIDAYNQLLELIGTSGTDPAEQSGTDVGETAGEATAKGIENKKGEVEKAAQGLVDAGKAKANTEATKFKEPGEKSGTAYADGIKSKTDAAKTAAEVVATAANGAAGGKSSLFNSTGANAGSNYVSGLNGQAGNAYSAGSNVGSSGVSGISAVGTSSAYTAGTNLGQGYVNGVMAKEAAAYAAGYKVGAAGVRGVNDGQKSGSPSKLTYQSGLWFVQGYINGIAKLKNSAVKTARSVAEAAVVELVKAQNWNYTEVGNRASTLFSDVLGGKLDYISDRIAYKNEKKIADFDKTIEKLDKAQDKSLAAEQKRTDKEQKRIKSSGDDLVKELEEASKLKIKAYETARDDEIKSLEDYRDAEVEKLQKQLDSTDDKTTKEQLRKDIQKQKDNTKKKVDAVKKSYKTRIDSEKTSAKKLVAAQKAANKKELEQEKASTKKTQAAIKKEYEKKIATQEQYRDAYQTASEKMLSEFDKAMSAYQDKAQKLIDDTIDGITDTYSQRYDDLIDKQNDLIDKMVSAGELFEVSGAGVMTVNDLKEQTKAITEYTDKLQKIRGLVSEELFSQITSYDMKEGSAFLDRLFEMTGSELDAYNKAYTEKIQTAQKAAEGIYQQDFNRVATEYQTDIEKAFNGIPDQLQTLGEQAMQGFIEGLTTNTDYMDKNVKTFVKGMITSFKTSLGIHSPSKVMFGIGEFTGEGFRNGLLDVVNDVKKAANLLADAATIPFDTGDISGIRGTVNAANPGAVAQGSSSVVNNYNLVQNNTSPKALSALETYQARRRQIAMVKAFA